MRNFFALLIFFVPLPLAAWEFTPEPVCTLTHEGPDVQFVITYDASLPEYALHLSQRDGLWPDGSAFEMAFLGPRGLAIGTDRQTLSDDRTTLTVRDTGFGNVLNGLEFNDQVVSVFGARQSVASLAGAAPAVRAFRGCPTDAPATS